MTFQHQSRRRPRLSPSRTETITHSDYEVGDKIRITIATAVLWVTVESKKQSIDDDPDRNEPGWTGTVTEVKQQKYDTTGNDVGTEMWGRTTQITEVTKKQ